MRNALLIVSTALLAACASEAPPTDDTDTDTDVVETDVEPTEVDASTWVIRNGVSQTYTLTLGVGERTQPLDFSDAPRHTVTPLGQVNFRNFIGERQAPNPYAQGPDNLRFEVRVIVPEDEAGEGEFDCIGTGRYGVTVALFGDDPRIPFKAFTSTRIDGTSGPCSITVQKQTLQRFQATIEEATLEDMNGAVIKITDAVLDLVLRDPSAPAD